MAVDAERKRRRSSDLDLVLTELESDELTDELWTHLDAILLPEVEGVDSSADAAEEDGDEVAVLEAVLLLLREKSVLASSSACTRRFNELVRRVRRERRKLWKALATSGGGGLTLIHQGECPHSDTTELDAALFLSLLDKGEADAKDDGGGEKETPKRKRRRPPAFQLTQISSRPLQDSFDLAQAVLPNADKIVLMDYMFDLEWLLGEHPVLLTAKSILIVHGDQDGRIAANQSVVDNLGLEGRIRLYRPALPIAYGTHHTKLMLLFYPHGMRVIAHTANMLCGDWNGKTQAAFQRDFPRKDDDAAGATTTEPAAEDFENYLCDYLARVGAPLREIAELVRKHDCSYPGVKLVASVPGRHTGNDMKRELDLNAKQHQTLTIVIRDASRTCRGVLGVATSFPGRFGHLRLRHVLSQEVFPSEIEDAPVVCQFSSLGSLQEAWLFDEFGASLTTAKRVGGLGTNLRKRRPRLELVWPTVEQVRTSLQGYASGGSIPCNEKNLKPFVRVLLHKWDGSGSNRRDVMPHIKTYVRYVGSSNLYYVLLTSANLSSAAWGKLEKNKTQLMVRSYEFGVLFLPSIYTDPHFFLDIARPRGAPTVKPSPQAEHAEPERKQPRTTGSISFQAAFDFDSVGSAGGPDYVEAGDTAVLLPIPYRLPPAKYNLQDTPWFWDGSFQKPDLFGQTWPSLT